MKLFTQEIDRKLFSQYNLGSDLSKQMVVAKIFNPYGAGRWFLINSDPQDPDYLWAIVDLFDIEVGSVSRTELQSIRIGKHGLPLERDLYFKPINAQELLNGLMQGQYYKKGGLVHNQNKEMLENQAKEFMHHSKELNSLVGKTKEVDAWVVAKAERASTDLSDITHYLDGRMARGGMISKGGEILSSDGKTYKFDIQQYEDGSKSIIVDEIHSLQYLKLKGDTKAEMIKRIKDFYGDSVKSVFFEETKSDDDQIVKGVKYAQYGNYKVGDRVLYAPNGKFHGANNVSYIKNAEITNVEVVSGVKIYTLEIKNKYGQVISKFSTSNLKELQPDPDFEMAKGGDVKKAIWHQQTIGKTPENDEGYWENYEYATNEELEPKNGRYRGYKWVLMTNIQEPEGYWEKKEMAEGGEMNDEEGINLFEDYENIPPNVQKILDKYEDDFIDGDYQGMTKALKELEQIGYTFEFYLDGVAYDLRPIGTKGKVESMDEFAMGGATFDDKVKAISKRLEGTKVPTRLKKDYGATYDKKEAKQAGKRIAGSILKKLKRKYK